MACLAFALLVFAVVWAWRSDRRNNGSGKESTSPPVPARGPAEAKSSNNGGAKTSSYQQNKRSSTADNKSGSSRQSGNRRSKSGTPEGSDESEVDVSAGLNSSKGRKGLFGRGDTKKAVAKPDKSAPVSKFEAVVVEPSRDIRDSLNQQAAAEAAAGAGGGDSVISDDVNTSLTAYYRSGVSGYAGGSRQRGYGDDAASLSSMDSYGYSLDGYAPSLGTAPNGYPVGPLAAAAGASIKVGDEDEEIPHEEVEDF